MYNRVGSDTELYGGGSLLAEPSHHILIGLSFSMVRGGEGTKPQ